MASKWRSLGIDEDSLDEGMMADAVSRPATKEDVTLFCDKNFPYLHIVNSADLADVDEPMSLSQAELPCGWHVYCYHRGETYLMLMSSRCAGRPDAPLPATAPSDVLAAWSDLDAGGASAQTAASADGDEDKASMKEPQASDSTDPDEGVEQDHDEYDDAAWEHDEYMLADKMGWRAQNRLAAAELIEFCMEHGMKQVSLVGGTPHMIDSAYMASRGCEGLTLETELSKEDKKRLDRRIAHLAVTYADEAELKETAAKPKKKKS